MTLEHDIQLPEISTDLLRASYRSDDFPQDWTEEQRLRSLRRYRMWLGLKQRHPRARLAPTRDIDLFWHLHMLAPVAYQRDCARLFGRVLDHDGGYGKYLAEVPILVAVFRETALLWEELYRVAYREDGVLVREAVEVDCWHDCSGRCWHACSSKTEEERTACDEAFAV